MGGVEVNVRGPYNALKAFAPVAAKNATAINVTSASAGLYVPRCSGYATAKLAACKMFEYFMHENPGVTAISFHPGVIKGTVSSIKAIASSGAVLDADSRKSQEQSSAPSRQVKLTESKPSCPRDLPSGLPARGQVPQRQDGVGGVGRG